MRRRIYDALATGTAFPDALCRAVEQTQAERAAVAAPAPALRQTFLEIPVAQKWPKMRGPLYPRVAQHGAKVDPNYGPSAAFLLELQVFRKQALGRRDPGKGAP